MRKTATITINDKVITINELTVRQIMGIKASIGSDTLETMKQLLLLLTDATPEYLLDLAPSELRVIYDKVKEVNADFLAVIPLDNLLAGYQDAMLEMIRSNLVKLSADSLQPDTV